MCLFCRFHFNISTFINIVSIRFRLLACGGMDEAEIDIDDSSFFTEASAAIGRDAAPDRRDVRGKKRTASRASAGGLAPVGKKITSSKPGPKTLEAALSSMRSAAEAVDSQALSAGVDLHRSRSTTLGQVTHVTTTYSGIGTAEAGVAEGFRQLREIAVARPSSSCIQAPARIQFHGAVECDNQCIAALQMHREESRASHLFVDILDRIPAKLKAELLRDVKRLRRRVEKHERLTRKIRGRQAADRERAKWVADLGQQFLEKATQALKEVDWSQCSESWCVNHGQMCPLAPAAGPRDLWMEITGSTCVAWSAMGSRWGWLDVSSVPCLVWLAWVAHAQPDCVVHENVVKFDWKFFQEWEITRGKFTCASLCHSPADQGIPANRPRRYTILLSTRLRLATVPTQPGDITVENDFDWDPLPAPQLFHDIQVVTVNHLEWLAATALFLEASHDL